MSGPVVKKHFKRTQKSTMQCGELRARSCPRSFEWIVEFQYGTSAYFVFITVLNARRIYAETSKKKIEKESQISSRRLGAAY